MSRFSRRCALLCLAASVATAGATGQPPVTDTDRPHFPEPEEEDQRLPNGKSQRDAIAASEHKEALKDADQLVVLATQIKTELERAGDFVVPLSTVKKTEEIEKLARHIRGRLKN